VIRAALIAVLLCALAAGCGTTKWSDSPRTATEQLLVSDSVDRAISEIDFSALADKSVYVDTRYIVTALDQNYVVSTLRQHMLASGCIIKDKAEDADYVVEVRSGALGTNRQDVLLGVPATNLPTAGLLPIGSAAIPEIALMKRTNQQAVCKIAVFAYDRMTGRPVWQSGNRKVASRAKDSWFMGAGPFQRGTIYDGTAFAGEKLRVPLVKSKPQPPQATVGLERIFRRPGAKYVADAEPNAAQSAASLADVPGGNPVATKDNAAVTAATGPAGAGGVTQASATTPATNSDATPAAAPATATAPAPATPPKPAYTPPPPSATPPPPQPTPGLQGPLQPQTLNSQVNPAAATAGAIQTYNWAKEFMDGQQF
jgi:hypothetical protein